MPTKFTITANNNPEVLRDVAIKGGKKTYRIDFSPWADDNHDVTSVTWSVESGQASISGEALSSNVATALIDFSEAGRVLIKAIASTASNEVYVAFIDTLVKDPEASFSNDYVNG